MPVIRSAMVAACMLCAAQTAGAATYFEQLYFPQAAHGVDNQWQIDIRDGTLTEAWFELERWDTQLWYEPIGPAGDYALNGNDSMNFWLVLDPPPGSPDEDTVRATYLPDFAVAPDGVRFNQANSHLAWDDCTLGERPHIDDATRAALFPGKGPDDYLVCAETRDVHFMLSLVIEGLAGTPPRIERRLIGPDPVPAVPLPATGGLLLAGLALLGIGRARHRRAGLPAGA